MCRGTEITTVALGDRFLPPEVNLHGESETRNGGTLSMVVYPEKTFRR